MLGGGKVPEDASCIENPLTLDGSRYVVRPIMVLRQSGKESGLCSIRLVDFQP